MPTIGVDGKVRCDWVLEHPLLFAYHDDEYGIPIHEDNLLFERLVLEQMQAGLSWLTVLKKRDAFRVAMDNFEVNKVASYDESKLETLLSNSSIIRNRAKLTAAIRVAQKIDMWHLKQFRFDDWLCINGKTGRSLDSWVALFKQEFPFVGREIVNEFLLSIGIFSYVHQSGCYLEHRKVNFFD